MEASVSQSGELGWAGQTLKIAQFFDVVLAAVAFALAAVVVAHVAFVDVPVAAAVVDLDLFAVVVADVTVVVFVAAVGFEAVVGVETVAAVEAVVGV